MSNFLFRLGCLGGCIAILILTGCAASSSTIEVDVSQDVAELTEGEREELLRQQSNEWHGTPHVLGGTSQRGVDCSGLVYLVYQTLFSVDMPRTTADQVRTGESVSRGQLQSGDLVFFRPTPKTRHVGIYLSDGEFVHAASSTGVSIDHLDSSYWRNRYWTSRRVLPESKSSRSTRAQTATDESATGSPDASPRSGW